MSLKDRLAAADQIAMFSARHALVAVVLAVVVTPGTVLAASTDTPGLVRQLAEDGTRLVSEERELLDVLRPDGDVSAEERSDARAKLAAVDAQADAVRKQLDLLGVDLTNAIRDVMAPLPSPANGSEPAPQPPPRIVYDAAIEDLARIAATPSAATPTTNDGNRGNSFGLLAVAAAALVALGLAALANSLRRTDEDRDLAAMAWSDGLTGVGNRRRLDRDLAAHAGDAPTAVIMIDVDHFKLVNDTHGHQVGDDVLRAIGCLLAEQVRRDDVVYRYGGEEFCILLPDATQADARSIADRIVDAARSITLPDGNHVTVSVGVADGSASEVAETLETADRALYAAKSGGRNRSSTSNRSTSSTGTLESV
jgi:diguanylate cyclase (GGDEF)-like protein